MEREVKIKICGTQRNEMGQEEPVEVVSVGKMCEQEGFLCISYDEVIGEEENGVVQTAKNMLKIKGTQIEVVKKGPAASHMVFMPDQTTYTYYSTPVGELEVSIHTNEVEKCDTDTGFSLKLQYELEMNQTYVSSCNVNIAVEY